MFGLPEMGCYIYFIIKKHIHMIKIINKGLSEKGIKEISKYFDYKFKVGQIVGNKSKTMKTFDPNTDMGNVRFCDTRVPLSWLNYELKKV